MKRAIFSLVAILILLAAASCDLIPSSFNIEADVETTSELGPDTLARIDAVNDTIATGLEVGPETREVIRELNETIQQGVKAGFDEDTLARVDDLLRVVEDGLKIGLDDETLASLNGMVNSLDQMPGNWEATATEIIRTLERSGGSMAGNMADEVKGVMNEARLNMQQMTAVAGVEFRCNVDFLGSKAGASLQEFIGKSIVGKLKNILSGNPASDPIPVPWVCQIIPDQIELVPLGGKLLFSAGVLTLTGYNYTDANSPRAYILDEAGNEVPGVPLFPFRSSPYQIQLNLQGLDFSAVPPRSRIVFEWPNVPETTGIALLMPVANPPVASFIFTPSSGDAPLTVQFTDSSTGDPSQWLWSFGDGATSNEQNPSHTFTEARSYEVVLQVTNALGASDISQTLVVGETLLADFSFLPRQGDAPLIVEFQDRSSGNPTVWDWDFGDGERSNEQNPYHVYTTPQPEGYTVTLQVSRGDQRHSKSSTDRILVREKLDADFKAEPKSGLAPLTVAFQNLSKGSNISSWLWDFGDGTTSTEPNPTHTFTSTSLYDVSLTVTTLEGLNDSEVKRGYINAFEIRLFRPGFVLPPLYTALNNVKVYQHTYIFNGGQRIDTGVPFDNYTCGVMGLHSGDSDIQEDDAGDILKAYLYRDYSTAQGKYTWWLTAKFRTQRDTEKWRVQVWCFDNIAKNSVFAYQEYTGLEAGKDHLTEFKTDDYSYCGIVGQAALMGDIQESGIHPILWQARMDGSSPYWQIKADFITHEDREETWNVNVLCLKRGSYPATEKPLFLTETYSMPTPTNHRILTAVPINDYTCGVVGMLAERGDIQENDTHPTIIQAEMVADESLGIWVIAADVLTHNREEDWTVDTLCLLNENVIATIP
jgi:PKD repeat protein